jgi:hypothetical protein
LNCRTKHCRTSQQSPIAFMLDISYYTRNWNEVIFSCTVGSWFSRCTIWPKLFEKLSTHPDQIFQFLWTIFNVYFECIFPTKALWTNGILMVLFQIFIDTFFKFFQACMLECRMITFERLLVFMNPNNMHFECIFLIKALLTNLILMFAWDFYGHIQCA